MSKIDDMRDLEVIVGERRRAAYGAHIEWVLSIEKYGRGSVQYYEAMAKKYALSDMLDEAIEELELLQEEVKHG